MITVNNLKFSFGAQEILKGVDASFDEPGLYGILGPNGAGKSTFLKVIMGIHKTPKKTVYLNDRDMTRIKRQEIARLIAYVPQQYHVDYDFGVYEVIAMGRHPYHSNFDLLEKEEYELIDEAIALTGVTELVDKKITQLSGGELQRVMIARAIVQDTPIILLDEPISHLDIHYQKEIIHLLRHIAHEKARIVITVLHDMNVGLNYCDYVHLMCHGETRSGKPSEVLNKHQIEDVYKTTVNIVQDQERQLIYW